MFRTLVRFKDKARGAGHSHSVDKSRNAVWRFRRRAGRRIHWLVEYALPCMH